MHKHHVNLLLLSLCLLFASPVFANTAKSEAIEAGSVSLTVGKDGVSGTVTVQQCARCPLLLSFSGDSKFKVSGKKVSLKSGLKQNGKPGTVIFNTDSKHVLKVSW